MRGLTTEEFHALSGGPTDEMTGHALLATGRIELLGETETSILYRPTKLGLDAVRIYARWSGLA